MIQYLVRSKNYIKHELDGNRRGKIGRLWTGNRDDQHRIRSIESIEEA
jgi:hypothetical protein